jgi:hypothetical protein
MRFFRTIGRITSAFKKIRATPDFHSRAWARFDYPWLVFKGTSLRASSTHEMLFDTNWLGVPSNLFSAIDFCDCVAVNLAAFAGAFGGFVAAVRSIRKTDNPPVDAVRISGGNPPPSEQRNTMRKFFLVVTLVSLSAVTGAIAEQTPQKPRSGTPEEQRACAHDVQRHCRTVMNEDDLTVLACLQHNRPKLTVACNQVLVNHGQ